MRNNFIPEFLIVTFCIFVDSQQNLFENENRIYRREIGDWVYLMDKGDTASWPDAFEECRKIGASLIHSSSPQELENIRQILMDPDLTDVDDFWCAGVAGKNATGFMNIDLNHELNLHEFLHGDIRCVSMFAKKPKNYLTNDSNRSNIDLNYRFCMTRKVFMCQEPKEVIINEPAEERQSFLKIYNGWQYSMDLSHYANWIEAFQSCKAKGANLISAGKYDQDSALKLTTDPKLETVTRFWSAGVINRNGVNTWLGKSFDLDQDPKFLAAILDGKFNCIYHRIPKSRDSRAESLMNHALCGVRMLFMCEQPTYQTFRGERIIISPNTRINLGNS